MVEPRTAAFDTRGGGHGQGEGGAMEGSRNLVMSTWGLDRRDGMETMAGGGRFTF